MSYDGVILAGGVNDKFFKNMEDGELMPAGSSFDASTIYGAWQSAVEYILNNYPNVIIYLTIPPIAWNGDNIYQYSTAKIKAEVAELYNLPYMDLYSSLGINSQNRDYYYVDDVAKTNWRIHFNDIGNELIGYVISGMLDSVPSGKTLSEIRSLKEEMDTHGLSDEITQALLNCFRHVVYTDNEDHYYQTLETALTGVEPQTDYYSKWSTNPPDSTYGLIVVQPDIAISEGSYASKYRNMPVYSDAVGRRAAIYTTAEYGYHKINKQDDTVATSLIAFGIELPPGSTGFTATFGDSTGTCLYVFKRDIETGNYLIVRDYIQWYTDEEVVTGLDSNSQYLICGSSKFVGQMDITIEVI